MADKIKAIVETKAFQWTILGMILVAAALVGLETNREFVAKYGKALEFLNALVLWIFVVEAALKMAQYGKEFYRYFQDPWNLFDFSIVVVCFLPVNASYAAVLRLARIMRALRLMTALPQLQLIVGALIKSIPSMVYVGILLLLNFYVYAVMGVFLFRDNDPVHFADLGTSMLTLFRVVTLEDWTDVMYIQMLGSEVYGGPGAYNNTTDLVVKSTAMPAVGMLYFVSFVMFGTMIMLNLFIGVILNSMEEAKHERLKEEVAADASNAEALTPDQEISVIQLELANLIERMNRLQAGLQNTREANQKS